MHIGFFACFHGISLEHSHFSIAGSNIGELADNYLQQATRMGGGGGGGGGVGEKTGPRKQCHR